jgi:hypothetical protein
MLACIIILTLYLAVPITLATAALFRPEIGAKTRWPTWQVFKFEASGTLDTNRVSQTHSTYVKLV